MPNTDSAPLNMRSFAAPSFATSASAYSVVTILLTKLQRTGAYLKGSADADRAHAAFLKRCTASGPATAGTPYVRTSTSTPTGKL